MALMHPSDLENYEPTGTEIDFYEACRDQLPDKFEAFYSIRWFETDEDMKRVDSECDFLVFDPSFGFLTIEVKGGLKIEVDNGHWFLTEKTQDDCISERELKCSPYVQAEKSMRHFYNYFKNEFNQKFSGVYGYAVAFPRYKISSDLAVDAPKELTIDIDDMSDLRKRINEIFHYWRSSRNTRIPFSSDQKRRFISAINKRISLSAAAGALIEIKKKQFARIDFVQDSILDLIYNFPQAGIIGGAGTGKTFIAMKKAMRDARTGKKVLFLCCSSELCHFVGQYIDAREQVAILTYVALVSGALGEEEYSKAQTTANGNKACFELVSSHQNLEKYDSIIVDEGQDFDDDMGMTVRCFLADEKNSTLYVFYDVNQNVFRKNYDDPFDFEYPPFILRYNIRNTGSIYQYAVDTTGLGADTIANQLLGFEPEVRRYKNINQSIIGVSSIVNDLTQKEYVPSNSIVLLSDVPYERSILATETRVGAFDISFSDLSEIKDSEICFKMVDDFKGLEANVVIYLQHDYPNAISDEVSRRRDYVALTRARYYLYVLHTKMH